uniref:Pentatricopeptide repeat-containing protein n=1 Tax=Lotus japonicus TaxID=34305 RepID=I3S5H3_LOTJA|nr:unknown [Lotus japonicus]
MKHYSTVISLSHQMQLKGIMPNFVTSNILIDCYCHLGQINFAFSVFATIRKRGYQPDVFTFATLINGFCQMGQIRPALQLLRRAEDDELVQLKPDVVIYS